MAAKRDAAPAARTVLFAPDSFKGSLSSVEVARALAEGWARARPDDRLLLVPLADGGEGTLEAIEAAGGWERRYTRTTTAVGAVIDAPWLVSADGTRAVIELAKATGLSLVPPADRDVLAATSDGTGTLIRAALDAGIRDIVLGIGGSATTDGGSGILRALGARLVLRPDGGTATGQAVGPGSGGTAGPGPGRAVADLSGLDRVDLTGLDPRLAETTVRIACDVTNPLLGPTGAAAIYGPQKGADPEAVGVLDGLLMTWADALAEATGRHEHLTPGAGAAGGVGFGLLCLTDRFRTLALQPGVDLVMDAIGFDAKLAAADVVVTGEGRIDAQTAYGKTALGVARRAQAAGVRCIAVGGGVEPDGIAALAPLGVEVVPVHERPLPVAEAIALGAAPLVACGERIAARPGGPRPSGRRQAARSIKAKARTTARSKPRRRTPPDPSRTWARSLTRRRPGLVAYVLDELAGIYERPVWERRLDPTSELILTVLTQNSADINAEHAFEGLRAAFPSGGPVEVHRPGAGWGGEGLAKGSAPDWMAVETAPTQDVVEAIRPGGLAQQKAPRIQAALRHIREARGDHSLEFLGDMPALEARDWLTTINGIGPKTASVLLLFCFGTPLMPVDRHVERVSKRIGLIPAKATADEAHDLYLALLEPDQMYEAHVNLIRHGRLVCHARKPECGRCPVAPRCRFVDRRAP